MTVILTDPSSVYCANVGDTKAILIWEQKKKIFFFGNRDNNQVNPNINILTTEHTPETKSEKLRIIKYNGEVR